jgi:hypothetical protein
MWHDYYSVTRIDEAVDILAAQRRACVSWRWT